MVYPAAESKFPEDWRPTGAAARKALSCYALAGAMSDTGWNRGRAYASSRFARGGNSSQGAGKNPRRFPVDSSP